MSVIKITKHDGSPFHTALKASVKNFFNDKQMTGNAKLFIKTAIIATLAGFLHFTPYFVGMGLAMYMLISVLKGFVMALAGFNIGHDAIHGSYSENAWINALLGFLSFDISGVSSWFWNVKHNIIHHGKTNTENDDDLNADKWLRLAPWQPWRRIHRYQHWYALLLYGFEHVHWALSNDFKKYFSHKIGGIKITRKMSTVDHLVFWAGKVIFVTKSIVLPIVLLGWLKGLIGFIIMEYVTGLVISVVFQLAHVQSKSQFFVPDPITGNVNEEWAVEQVKSSADFSTRNRLITWLLGGLNFQTIHHLFPKISHVHYKSIQGIVIEKCDKFGLEYNHYDTIVGAIKDHFSYLKGNGKEPEITIIA